MSPGTCKHFNGDYHNKACCAGVVYDDVTPDANRSAGKALRRPCHSKPIFTGPHQLAEFEKRGTCTKYCEPTAEDIAQYEKEIEEDTARMMKATAVKSHAAPLSIYSTTSPASQAFLVTRRIRNFSSGGARRHGQLSQSTTFCACILAHA